MNRLGLTTLAVIAAIASPAVAQTPQDAPPPAQRRMIDYLVNAPHVQNWMTWGVTPAPTPQAAEGVTGGQAVRVAVARGGDPWSVGAIMTNPAAITTGDVILVAVWIRRSDSNAATSPTSLPLLMVESQTEPKTVIARSMRPARRRPTMRRARRPSSCTSAARPRRWSSARRCCSTWDRTMIRRGCRPTRPAARAPPVRTASPADRPRRTGYTPGCRPSSSGRGWPDRLPRSPP